MKNIFFFVVLTLLITFGAQAQTKITTNNIGTSQVVSFEMIVDSLSTLTTNPFTLSSFDGESFYTYPLSYGYILTSVAGLPRVSMFIQGSFDGSTNWTNADTLATSDSTETFRKLSFDLNNAKYPYYRISVTGTAGNRRDTDLKFWLYAYRKD